MYSNSKIYKEDLDIQYNKINFELLKNKSILITGATGLICSYLTDLLMYANKNYNTSITIYVLAKTEESAKNRFKSYIGNEHFNIIAQDVCDKIDVDVDYIIHGASNANPKLAILDPVGTMNANYIGMLNVLENARKYNSKVIYISSSDIYGKNNTEKEFLEENDYGYVDILDVKSSYASSKRATETLCISYNKQYNCDVKIVRPVHIYGPTFRESDTRVISEFLKNVINKQNIIMKSDGSSVRSYCYVGDMIIATLKVLLYGIPGEAYNICNENEIVSIKELANIAAELGGVDVEIQLPDNYIDKKIDSNVKVIKISNQKLKNIGFDCDTSLHEGLKKCISVNREIKIER